MFRDESSFPIQLFPAPGMPVRNATLGILNLVPKVGQSRLARTRSSFRSESSARRRKASGRAITRRRMGSGPSRQAGVTPLVSTKFDGQQMEQLFRWAVPILEFVVLDLRKVREADLHAGSQFTQREPLCFSKLSQSLSKRHFVRHLFAVPKSGKLLHSLVNIPEIVLTG